MHIYIYIVCSSSFFFKASPQHIPAPFWQQVCAGWLSVGMGYTADWLSAGKGHFHIHNCYFEDLESPFSHPREQFSILGYYFGDPGIPRDTQQDTLGSRRGLLSIFDGFVGPHGIHFGVRLVTFSYFGPRNCSMGSRVSFLAIRDWKSGRDLMLGCAETTINTYVFVRFHFLSSLRIRVSF